MGKKTLDLGFVLLLSLAIFAACQRNAPRRPTPLPTDQYIAQGASPSQSPAPSGTDTPTRVPTPTWTATRTATPTITPTPTLSPTPTPTPIPSDRLVTAQQAFDWGDHRRAYAEFTALLADPGADDAETQLAAYWAGRSALEAGDYQAALAALRDFIQTYPSDPRVASSHFLMARAYAGLGDWQGVMDAYQAYVDDGDGTLDIYAYEGMGDAAMLALDYDRAAQAYTHGVRVAPDNAWGVQMREGIAHAELARGNPDEAVEQYDTILSIARIRAYRAKILYLAGQALMMAGDTQAAHERFLQSVNRYPEAYDSYLALVELVNAQVPVDDYQRGLTDYHAEVYQPAIEAFTRYLEADTEGYKKENARWYLALSLKANGNLWQAIQNFEEFIETYPDSEHAGEAWLEMAETYAWQDNVDQALSTYRSFAGEYPQSPLAPTALWEAAELEVDGGDLEKAAASFRDLAARFPGDEGTPEALFNAALLDYRRGEFDAARDGWETLVQDHPDSQSSLAARFWLGKVWLALQKPEEAKAAFNAAHKWAPDSYYGLRASEMLDENEPEAASADPPALSNPDADQRQAEEWISSWLPVTGTLSLATLDEAIAESPAFRRGDALLAAGRRAEALEEFETIKETWWDDPLALYQLSLAFRDRGLYRLSIITAERLTWLSPVTSRAEVPDYIQHLSFPLHYQELILSEAQTQEVDPLLLFSLIRQESLFEASITSAADARGLTQIIPPTGDWIAGRLGWEEFSHDDLYRPYINIQFGVFYLSVQLATFEQEPIPALAAYNAGPGRIHRWQEDAPDVDLLVETMPFAEPRRYVRNVYENYGHYRRLYLNQPEQGGN
jgi:soluble lytic murein transglycosylase